jgi:HD-GYP domain-containing protein (c-di-GMP phosphodiesterase class II)
VLGMATAFGAEEAELRDLRRAALLHDLGKLAISNRILDKPAALTSAEFRQVQQHPLVTEQILRRLPGHAHIASMAGAHHERLDGGGYPRGLAGSEMTANMRLLAVADVYEALTSERPYRSALRSDEALAIIRADVPNRLDHEAFAVLVQLLADEPEARERFDAGRVQAALDHDPR